MFKWSHEYTVEVNVPISKVWEFYSNPSNWPKWMDQLKSCNFEGDLRPGLVVNAKVKNGITSLPILITQMNPCNGYKILKKVPFFTQESSNIFKEVYSERTFIIMKTSVTSLLTPFMKSYFSKKVESSFPKCLRSLMEATGRKI